MIVAKDSVYFDSITSASEYLEKLQQVIDETNKDIDAEIATGDKRPQRINGLMLARYKLELCGKYLARGARSFATLLGWRGLYAITWKLL